MATSIESYFFHQDHNVLTVDDIRKHGFAAKEASNGFIEAFPTMQFIIAEKELELKRSLTMNESNEIHNFYENRFLDLLISGVKDDCPPIMKLCYDGDYENTLTIFTTPTLKETIADNHLTYVHSKIARKLEETYGISDYYSHIRFARHTEYDLITDEQRKQKEAHKKQLEDYEYNLWLKTFSELTERQKLQRLKDVMSDNKSSYVTRSNTDSYKEKLFIERYVSEE
ncbi:TPA: hypothetical protein RI785_003650 [Vibrio cholerae]|uniref:Uncharacterized protein n=1 Tax=Vibrio cholerae TaxID=666 RepID=A0A5Q6PDF5_VIBCL|nr:hypothetical protein [Vibrio cholerae]KAA1252659.1 hypothetical protein F0M16_21680 [Vibrio cholerae]HDV5594881.1 hypothetical protein [Vibrio cholerae]